MAQVDYSASRWLYSNQRGIMIDGFVNLLPFGSSTSAPDTFTNPFPTEFKGTTILKSYVYI
jgi:hypothetical protein